MVTEFSKKPKQKGGTPDGRTTGLLNLNERVEFKGEIPTKTPIIDFESGWF